MNPYVLCYRGEKRPIGNDWGHRTIDELELSERLAADPELNVGIILGPDTGYIDVECDGEGATAHYAELFGDTRTPTWRSLRGCHYLYSYDTRLTTLPATVKLESGLEFRLGNGKQTQSIIPPSTVDGVRREWIVPLDDCEPAPVPEQVMELLLSQSLANATSEAPDASSIVINAEQRDKLATKLREYCARHGLVITPEHNDHLGRLFLHLAACPFKPPEHEDGDPSIMLTSGGHPKWACRHAKCQDKNWSDVEGIYWPLYPVIRVNHELHRVVEQASHALAEADNIYQYGRALVSIVYDAEKPKLCLNDNGSPQLIPLPQPTLKTRLSACAAWYGYDGRKGDWKRTAPPENVISAIHVAESWPSVPVITGIVSCPVLRSDGSILTAPGYDKLTGLFLDTKGDYPPLMQPAEAVGLLADVLHDFPFESPAHRSGWIAALITLLACSAIAGSTPFFLVDANASRIGKGLLTDVLTMIAEGRKACRYSWPSSDEETRKLITTVGMSGAPYLLFDNIKDRKLGGPALELAMTTAVWGDRLLSLNRRVEFPINFVWLGTGNNCALTDDMIGRTCHIRLTTALENPAERSGFRHTDLLGHVKANRHKLVMAALSIPAGYIRAHRPDKKLPTWGGFQEWSDLVRNSIVWAGQPDPGLTRIELREQANDDLGLLRSLISAWPDFPATIAKVIDLSAEHPALQEVIAELPGRDDDKGRALGYLLRDARGRVIGGKRFERVENTRPTKWQVVTA